MGEEAVVGAGAVSVRPRHPENTCVCCLGKLSHPTRNHAERAQLLPAIALSPRHVCTPPMCAQDIQFMLSVLHTTPYNNNTHQHDNKHLGRSYNQPISSNSASLEPEIGRVKGQVPVFPPGATNAAKPPFAPGSPPAILLEVYSRAICEM